MNNVLLLILLIAGGGVLGGLANYFMNRTQPGWLKGDFWKSVVVGLAAAAVVPLFLQTVSSNLVAECLNNTSADQVVSCLVFFGFCTIAAIFSARFLTSIADKVLREVEEMKQTQNELVQTTDALVDVNSDDQGGATSLESLKSDDDGGLESFGREPKPAPQLTSEEKLMWNMENGRRSFRTVDVLAKDAGLDVSTVENILQSMENRGIVKKMRRNSDGETLWMLSR
jgi:ribosomal protein S25